MIGPSVSVKDCSLVLAGVEVLRNSSVELQAGLLHAFIGGNGAGKTSLLKCLLGLNPHRGTISIAWSGEPQRPVYIPQQPKFDSVLPITVKDYLLAHVTNRPVFFKAANKSMVRVNDLLEQVGLAGKQKLKIGRLSGGERQRLMFAQALSKASKLWFLDEPLTGLDEQGQEDVTQLMLDLKAQQYTLIMVHHDLQFVGEHADNVVLVDRGITHAGSPEQVLATLKNTNHFGGM